MKSISFVWGRATGVGGTEQRMAEAAAHLVRLGHQVDCWFPADSRGSPLHALMSASGARVHFVVMPLLPLKLFGRRDVVVAMGFRASIASRVARIVSGRRWPLIDARNGLEFRRGSAIWKSDLITGWAVSRYVCNSHAAAGELRKHGIRADRIHVVPSALGDQWSSRPTVSRDPNLVLVVGNARPEKNQLFGLRAVHRAALPGVHVRVFTDDASELARAWASTRGSEEVPVEFVEGARVTPEIMAAAGVLLHPSVSESMPRTVLEAVSQGTWVVASDCGDSHAAVNGSGHVVPVNDIEAFASALKLSISAARSGAAPAQKSGARGIDQYCREFFAAVAMTL